EPRAPAGPPPGPSTPSAPPSRRAHARFHAPSPAGQNRPPSRIRQIAAPLPEDALGPNSPLDPSPSDRRRETQGDTDSDETSGDPASMPKRRESPPVPPVAGLS